MKGPLTVKGLCSDLIITWRYHQVFLDTVAGVWRHSFYGTKLYSLVYKLKLLKPVFRAQRKSKGDLAMNVQLAAAFLTQAQPFVQKDKHTNEKTPGPDGYSAKFYNAAWLVIGLEVSVAVREFFANGRMLKQINATLLTLLPKVHMPCRVSEHRPIACCYNQRRLPPRCALKVDLRKAYDSVEWNFLIVVLKLFRFPSKFIGWIQECVTTTNYSISLNGGIAGFFNGAEGLDKGILSPFICLLW
ncbi:UNVERIFIED_CONTAM: hypothetical protein Sradi_0735900 [Sesamum radiatum]|uniref:Reverse transcriptase domain-containing protein n=1 Tax=Sesamum radiatum TaxID=300843 RepID=A0AAW2VQ23_SESRA